MIIPNTTKFQYLKRVFLLFGRVQKIANSDHLLRRVRPCVHPSDLLFAWIKWAPTGRIFMKFAI
jgi:hypothetical protein